MASVAAAPRWRVGQPADDAQCLPRSRAPELDSQLRSVRARDRTGHARARDCLSIRGSESEIRVMITLKDATTKTRRHEEERSDRTAGLKACATAVLAFTAST